MVDAPVTGIIHHLRTDLGRFVGSRRRESSVACKKLGDRSQRTAAENRLDRRLADTPVPRPQQPDGAVNRVHGSTASFVEQGLKQS